MLPDERAQTMFSANVDRPCKNTRVANLMERAILPTRERFAWSYTDGTAFYSKHTMYSE
jgi:hypothetical protein